MNKKVSYILIIAVFMSIMFYAFKITILFLFNDVKLTVPNVVGLTLEKANEKTSPIHLNITVSSEEFSEFEKGTIISQSPEAEKEIKQAGNISVVVSKGIQKFKVPDFRGLDLYAAKKLAEENNLKIKGISRTHHEFEVEQVISSEPKAGSYISGSNAIYLLLSLKQAVKTVPVPDLTGVSLSEVESLLTKSGLVLGEITYVSNFELDNDIVTDTSPAANKDVPLGSVVNIVANRKE